MNKSAEIRSQIDAKIASLTTLNDTEGKSLTEETRGAFQTKFDGIEKEITNLKADEKRELSMESMRLEGAAAEKRKLDLSNASGAGLGKGKEDVEVKRTFSISNFISEARNGGLTGINKEMHEEAVSEARNSGRAVEGYGMPAMLVKRNMNAVTDTAGGYTVPTEVMSIVDYLYNKSTLRGLGADFMTGLTSDISFPVRDNAITSGWLSETAGSSAVSPTFAQKSMSPKRIGSYIDLSNQLITQSNASIDTYITRELGGSMLVDLEAAAIYGTGSSNQPTGILNTAGIGSVAMGTNGGAIDWASIVKLITEVAQDNAEMGDLNYLTNAQVRGAMQTILKASGVSGYLLSEANAALNGYGLGVSQHVPSNLTKGTASGVCSALIYGNFNDLKIAQWGGLDILVDKYTQAEKGTTRVVANGYFDVLALRPQSFAAIKDITTA
jgi:HK97 family phage major capsid protein